VCKLPRDISIRLFHADDKAQVRKFACANPSEKWTKAAQSVIRDAPSVIAAGGSDASIAVAVDAEDRIVGVVVFGFDPGAGQQLIHALGVVKDRRRQYIGLNLKEAALAELAASHRPQANVFSEVHKLNHAMLALNDKMGAERKRHPDDSETFVVFVAAVPVDDEIADDRDPAVIRAE
jgi:RimJ/RimL family protein N-acetyltransferase